MEVFQCRVARDFVCVQGDDAESYLQSQLSNQIQGMAVQSSKWSLLLQPTGKVDAVLRVTRFEDTVFVLDTDPGFGAAVIARLNRFKIRVKATVEAVDWQCVAIRGSGARAASAVAGRVPSEGLVVDAGRGADSALGVDEAVDLVGAQVALLDSVAEGGVAQLERCRVACGWPSIGVDFEAGCVPAETGIVAATVSFTKGCYPGQELVERMDSRASSAPFTVRHFDDPGLSVGDAYVDEAGNVGTVTSVGGGKVLVRVKRG
jgi:folate-binding protein YgfZ